MTPTKLPGDDYFLAPIPILDLSQPTIPFQKMPLPDTTLTFIPRPSSAGSRKRGRAAADVDGEHSSLHKKKRRLRLFLITSRLSPQFSHPATNIVDRGTSKIAVWAKQKNLGRNLLRKAAILNRIRRNAIASREDVSRRRLLVEQEKEQRQLELARLTFNYGAIDTYTRPVHLQPNAPPPVALRLNAQHHITGSPTGSPSGSPATSRSSSPSSVSSRTCGPGNEDSPDYRSPNAAYALSPPRAQSSTRTYEPYLPSPLGLSNYDAFDTENVSEKDQAAADLYSHLDDDAEEDRYSYLWDDMDDRHDSPFSPSVVTNDSRATANTGTSTILETPPQTTHDDFNISESYLGRVVGDDDGGDSVWPSPYFGSTVKSLAKSLVAETKQRTSDAILNSRAFVAGPLAVQYPGAPVSCAAQLPESIPSALSPNLLPASMSPNFLPADAA